MSSEQIWAFLAFAVVAAITPGPSNVMITAAGANAGIRGGLPCLLGAVAGMAVMMSAVTFGMGALFLERPQILAWLKWIGAAFLLWLAWRIASAKPAGASAPGRAVGFVPAALFQWVNPKSWMVCAGAAGTYLQAQPGSAIAQSLLLGGLFVAAALPSGFVWLAFGVGMQRLLRSPRRLRAFNVAMGALLAGSVALFLSEG